ncbi:hypothetical protein DERF_006092 [Dermatophagoides farinae]|uniref:Uncharacterized protein n=1 Tax=Dermatophagoides farinae TaxID=6954 RepID=A0A922I5J7_DERFA|nr:hypothetical protein DERF_006092 [Dermatophagoides farinae]
MIPTLLFILTIGNNENNHNHNTTTTTTTTTTTILFSYNCIIIVIIEEEIQKYQQQHLRITRIFGERTIERRLVDLRCCLQREQNYK